MVTLSKKEQRKAGKGKSKAEPASILKKPAKAIEPEEDEDEEESEDEDYLEDEGGSSLLDDESDEDDLEDDDDDAELDDLDEGDSDDSEEDEDEENGGVSEKGLQRLMQLVGEDDLEEYEKAALGLGEEDSDEEDDEEEDDDDEELEAEDAAVEEEAEVTLDGDELALDQMGSDVSVDEDAVPKRKVVTDNKPAMKLLRSNIQLTNLPWPEHLTLSGREPLTVDPSDDLQREMAFYKTALDQVSNARKLCAKHGIPFSRPNDYYAEMVKSDEHMERVRTKLVEEATSIKKSEDAKKQRDLKKFGKQIQHEKLKQREMDKKSFTDKMQGIKRKRKEGMEIGGEGEDDEFGIQVDDALEGRQEKQRGGPSGRGKPKVPRHVRDAKYSLGGAGKRSKQNTRDSTNDFAGWGDSKGGKNGKGKGGKGGKGNVKNRPGKSRRKAGRA